MIRRLDFEEKIKEELEATNNMGDEQQPAATVAEGEDQPTLSINDLKEMADAEDDLMTAIFAGSDERNCSYPRGYVKRQALFACRDCSDKKHKEGSASSAPFEPSGVCLACAIACHADHDLVELYTKRNFRCDCGNSKLTEVPCRLCPQKEADNPQNSYNHNFSGLYCVCNKPYPCDPEDSEVDRIGEDEMVQCIICEDWYHACHLNIPPEDIPLLENDDEEYELVCPSCCEKHLFLTNYYKHFKKSPQKASDEDQAKGDSQAKCKLEEIKAQLESSEPDSSDSKVLLLPPMWRAKLCKCNDCLAMYEQQNIAFVTDLSDTLVAYEAAGRARTADSGGVPISDRLVTATLAGIRDRVVQTEIAHGYAELKTMLSEFIQDVGKRKRVVTESDINDFFERLGDRKRKRTDDGGSGGASSSNSRSADDE